MAENGPNSSCGSAGNRAPMQGRASATAALATARWAGSCWAMGVVWLVARWPSSGGTSNESWLAARTPLEQQQLVEEGEEMRKKNSVWPLPFVSCINE